MRFVISSILFSILLIDVQAQHLAADESTIKSVRLTLEQMLHADQAVRKDFDPNNYEHIAKMHAVDLANQAQLKEIIKKVGWPYERLVGKDASQGAFLVAQHAASDLEFMKEVFVFIEAGYKEKQVAPSHYALMYDRIQRLEGKPQKYGTQFQRNGSDCSPWKLIDPQKVDEYRAKMGLDSLAAYAKRLCQDD